MFNLFFPRVKIKVNPRPMVLIRGLNKLPGEMHEAINRGLVAVARSIVARMKDSMKGAKHGETYDWKKWEFGSPLAGYRRGWHGKLFRVMDRARVHHASAPGEAPARDTRGGKHSLYKSIRWRQTKRMGRVRQVEAGVDWNAPYAEYLEYGSAKSNLQPRPMLMPAVKFEVDRGGLMRTINRSLQDAGFKALK